MSRRHKLVIVWSLASLALFAVLFPAFGATPRDLVDRLVSAPPGMYAMVLLLTVANQLAGAQKWRMGARQFSHGAHVYSLRASFETTVLGAFLGQVLPVQLATALVRGLVGGDRAGGATVAIGATAYEQLFDLVVLTAAALAGTAAIGLGAETAESILVVSGAACAGVLLSPQVFAIVRALLVRCPRQGQGRIARTFDRGEAVLEAACKVPRRVTTAVGLLSVARMLFMAGRVVVVAAVIAPQADCWQVAIGYPIIGVVGALPIAPGGLGVVEWGWSGMLLHAGAQPADAAVAAISLRIVNLAALAAILAVTVPLHLILPQRVRERA